MIEVKAASLNTKTTRQMQCFFFKRKFSSLFGDDGGGVLSLELPSLIAQLLGTNGLDDDF